MQNLIGGLRNYREFICSFAVSQEKFRVLFGKKWVFETENMSI